MPQTVNGREPELARIAEFLERLPDGARVLLIDGEAGIGKSTLWQHAVERAADRSWRVLAARPTDVEASFAFAGLGDLLEGVDDRLLDRLPTPQQRALRIALLREEPDGPAPDPRAVAVGLLNVLRILAADGPLLVAVDDFQWLDAASAGALVFAIRRLRDEPIGTLLARRVEAPMPMPRVLDRWPIDRLERIHVGAIGVGALRRLLLDQLAMVIPRTTVRRIHASSGGNPFFALELARAARSSATALEVWMEMPASSELGTLLERRLSSLPGPTQDALAVAAALRQPMVDLVAVVESGPADAWLDPAVEARILEVRDGRLAFVHPLLASAVHSRTPARRRRRIHEVLAGLVKDPEERARHLGLATQTPAEPIAMALEDAARRAYARGAADVACDLAAEARRLTPAGGRDALRRRGIAEADFAIVACDFHRARSVLEEILDGSPPGAARADALNRLAGVATRGGEWRTAVELGRLALTENHDDDGLRARIEFGLGATLDLSREDIVETMHHLTAALELSERVQDNTTAVEALGLLAKNEQRLTGRMPVGLIERALAREGSLPQDRWDLRPTDLLAGMLAWTDEQPRALEIWENERQVAADHGFVVALSWILARMIVVEVATGTWDRALEHADEALEIALEGGQIANQAVILAGRSLVTAHLGDIDATRDLASRALSLSERSGAAPARRAGAWALGLLELSLDQPARAHEHLAPLVHEARSLGIAEVGELAWVADDVEALIGLSRLPEAEALLDWFEGLATAGSRQGALGVAARCRGLIHTARGELDSAQSVLESAQSRLARVSRPFELARTNLALGVAQRHAMRKLQARTSLDTALAGFERLGARRWAEKAQAELASIGGRAPAGDALTPTELRVAALVAEGGTNREVAAALFLTDRTVEGHLTRIYAKLQVRSRSELARRFVAQREDVPAP